MTTPPEIPPHLKDLYAAAGPVLRYRIMRDVVGHDDSYIATAHLGLDLRALPEAQTLKSTQELDGTWNGLLCSGESHRTTTEVAVLRLCELGLEGSESVRLCLESALLPTLFSEELLWEFEETARDKESRVAARHIVRDKALRLICRAARQYDAEIKPLLEAVMAEWEYFLQSPTPARAPRTVPTADAYAAVCWYPWSEDDFPRVRDVTHRLIHYAEAAIDEPVLVPDVMMRQIFQLTDKWEYLARPDLLFHELELAARLGVVNDLPHTRWLLEELEARQDADGWCRFEVAETIERTWYFPLDKEKLKDYPVEWTFRAALIFKLLEYDL